AVLYQYLDRYEESERYYRMAIKKGHVDAHFNLAVLYQNLDRIEETAQYYLKVSDMGDVNASTILGVICQRLRQSEKAERYLSMAVEKGCISGANNLAVYYWLKNQKRAICWSLMDLYIKNMKERNLHNNLTILLVSAWARKPHYQNHRLIILSSILRDQ